MKKSLLAVVLLVVGLAVTSFAAASIDVSIGIKDPGFERSDPTNSNWRGTAHKDALSGSYYQDNKYDKPDLYGTWTPNITVAGKYNVYLRWIAHPNRSAEALVNVVHKNGTAELKVNQQINGAQWNLLGQYEFAVGETGYVRLFSSPGYTVFDGVRFELVTE